MATAAGALGVWDWNFVTNELFVDRKLKSLLGFDDAEISTRPDDWGSRVHPEDLSSAAALVQACIAGQSDVYELEHRMLHKDGSVKWFLSRGSAVRGTDGVLHRLVGTKVDITERKRAAELFRLAIEAAPAGMITVDSAGTIVLVNAQVEKLFGYERSALIGKPIEMLVPEPFGDDPPGTREVYGIRNDGTRVPIEVGVSRLETWEGPRVLLSVVDIADRQRSERENRYLMDQLQDLAGSLITAQDAERARIARDLHDDVSQQLAALSIALSGIEASCRAPCPRTSNCRSTCPRSSSARWRWPRVFAISRTICIPTCSGTPGWPVPWPSAAWSCRAPRRLPLPAPPRETSNRSAKRPRSACTGLRRRRCTMPSSTPVPAMSPSGCSAAPRRSSSR